MSIKKLNLLKQMKTKERNKLTAQMNKKVQQSIMLMTVTILLASVLSIGLLIIISKKLQEVVVLCENLSSGHLGARRMSYTKNDEIEQVAFAMHELADYLQHRLHKFANQPIMSTKCHTHYESMPKKQWVQMNKLQKRFCKLRLVRKNKTQRCKSY